MDVLTIVFIVLIGIALLVASIYLLAYYCHPEDRGFGSALICKIAVVLGLCLAWAQVLMLPLDVTNMFGEGGGIDMQLFWYIVYISTGCMILFVIPTLTAFYESDPEWSCWEKVKYSFCCLIAVVIVALVILVVLYAAIGKAYVPINTITCPISFQERSNRPLQTQSLNACYSFRETLEIGVSFPIYIIAFMSFISWFLFVLFGGIGLAAVPLDLFYDFCTRPKRLKAHEIENYKKKVLRESESLKQLGNEIKELEEKGIKTKYFFNAEKRNYDRLKNQFSAGIVIVEKEYQIIVINNEIGENAKWVILYWLLIPLGIISICLTLAWVAQIFCTFIITSQGRPIYPLISTLLYTFQEQNVSFLSFGFFSLFVLYLLIATIKGNIKFGLRFMCWKIHPMKKNETYMNSFLFNIMLILLSSVSITQFCAACFPEYIAMTDINLIFSVQVRYLVFFVYFFRYHVFEYALFGVFVISTIYLLCRPSDVNSIQKLLKKNLEEGTQLKIVDDKNKDRA